MAPILTIVKTYIPVNLLNLLIINLVTMTPKIAPNGNTPISIDCAANLSIVMPYSSFILAIGTEVIYLRL